MKKSELYKLAEMCVVECDSYGASLKLEILRELMKEEDIAKIIEKREEEEANNA